MTTLSDPHTGLPGAPTIVHNDEPKHKPPPLLVVGPLAWIRNNLFKSTLDTLLTIGFGLLAISVVTGVIGWTVTSANWFVITKNLRLFMVGRFPVEEVWRAEWLALFLTFLIGFSIATWSRVSRGLLVVLAALVALTFVIPPVVYAVTAPPELYVAAGNAEIASGTVTETPVAEPAFIGQAGTPITIRIAPEAQSDDSLAALSGFLDRSTAAVVNAARNRLTAQDEIAAFEQALAGDLLTEAEREAITADLAALEVPDPVSETLAINSAPVLVQIVDGQTLDVLAEQLLEDESSVLSFTLPHDGWYLLRKTVEAEDGTTILRATNIDPLMVSELSALDVRYRSMTTDFETSAARPVIDGDDAAMMNINDYQYAGGRTVGEFFRLHLAPFLDQVNVPFLAVLVAGALGYNASRLLDRTRPIVYKKRASQRFVRTLWLLAPVVTYILIAAVEPTRWGGLLLTFLLTAVGILASFPIGVLLALGRRSSLPVVKWTCIVFIELVRGVPLISVLFIANLMLPLLNPALVSVPGVLRAMVGITLFSAAYLAENVRGGLQSIPHGQEEAAKALGLNGFQVTTFITLPQALRAVIPALVGQAIALFKDTSLVAIIGLFDLTRIADSTIAQSEFIGARPETYLFISIIYFVISYLMAVISRSVESSGSGAARRI